MSVKLLQARWQAWEARFIAMSRRERVMVSAAVLVGVVMIGSTVVLEPLFKKNRLANTSVVQQSEELAKQRLQLLDVQQKLKFDPNAAKREEIAKLNSRLQDYQTTLNHDTGGLVPPAQMNAMLEHLLGRQPGLRLVSLRSLPPTSLLPSTEGKQEGADGKKAAGKGRPDLYRHGVEIKIAGSYNDLYQYLLQLESNGQKLLWGEVTLSAVDYPTSVLTLVVYTLSAEKIWLSI